MPQEFLSIYEHFISPSPDHISIVDTDYKYLVISEAYLKAHGRKREEILGHTAPEILGERAFNGFIKGYLDRCFAGEVINYREWFEFKAAGRLFMNVTYYPYIDGKGAIKGAVVISRDITEYKAAEEKLRDSEEKYRHLFENLNDAALLADVETGILVETNRRAESLLGRPRSEIIGMHQSQIHPPHLALEYREKFAAHISKGRSADYDGVVVRKDGAVVDVHISAAPITIGGRRFILGIFRDITERKRYEEEILGSKRFTESLIRSMHDGFSIFDGERRFVDGNPALFQMTGFDREELAGKGPPMPYWPEDAGRIEEMFDELETGASGDHEFIFRKKDGAGFPVIVSPFVLRGANGRVKNYCATVKDITYRKDMERELLRSRKLESLGTLAGGIAHNFNNLLTGIMGNISLALLLGPDEKVSMRLVEAERACYHAKDLVRRFITFSKGGAPVKSPVVLEAVAPEWCSLVTSGSRSKCDFRIEKDLLPIDADEGLISQAIQNIVVNADQAMTDGGIIKVSVFNASTDSQGRDLDGPHVCVRVEDSGVGMSEAEIEKIFDPYYTTREGSSGLGLASAYSIIRSHGGFIEVKSRPGQGSAFSVYLPACKAVDEKKAAPGNTPGTRRVLVMDDEEIIREAASEIIGHIGYEAVAVEDGARAIEAFRAARNAGKPFDLVIMDLTIPAGMGGKEAVRHLLEIDPGARVVVSSGYSNDPVMSEFSKYGFSGVIAKPYRAGDVMALVKKLLG